GVLTITFDRKPAINPAMIAQGLPAYIGSARADADGLVFRFALAQNVRLHSSASANKIAIDLLPDSFSGTPADLPPPPPREQPAVDVSKLEVLKIHAGAYSSYSRIIFDWPRNVPYAVFAGASHISIRFEAMARPDFSGFENVSPPWVKEAGWRIENKGTVIDFGIDGQSGHRDSRNGAKIVLDILAPKLDSSADASAGSDSKAGAQAEITGKSAAAGAQAKAIADTVAQLNGEPQSAAVNGTPAKDALAKPVAVPQAAAAPANTDAAQALRTKQGVVISFAGAGGTPAAVFIRGMTAWIVLDGTPKIDPVHLKTVLGEFPASLDIASSNAATIIRIGLKQPEQISAMASGSSLRVAIGPDVAGAPETIDFVRNEDDPKHPALATLVPGATHAVALSDAAAGDSLIVVPGVAGRGVLDARHYAEFAILPTAAGLVVEPYTDDLMATVSNGHVQIDRPGGLAMTSGPAVTAQSPSGLVHSTQSPSFLDLGNWSRQGPNILAAERRLRANIAAQRPEDANHARLALARLYLGKEFAAEALGLINLMVSTDPSLQGDMQLQAMRAAADYMMGRYRDAHNELGSAAFDNDRDAALWRGLTEAGLEDFDGARKAFALAEPVFYRYPPEWRARALLAEANAALAANAVETADAAINHLPHDLSQELALEAQFTRARLYASEGRTHDARELFAGLLTSGNAEIAAQSVYGDVEAGLSDGSMTRDDAIAALEQLRYRWRGDALELRTLRKLGALYFEKRNWRQGLLILRIASQNFPNEELARQAQDDMRAIFVNLFLKGKADAMPPIQALSLFYDFIDLTPIGPDGDEMIRRMSDRLVAVDLLGPAESLLNYQVTRRLDGIARAQVATRLAMIDLMDHKPKDALATLRATDMAGLPDDIIHARMLLSARSLGALKQWDQALDLIAVDEAPDTRRLRADIYWESGNWAAAGQKAEELVADRWKDTTPLGAEERQELMRAAIAYSLASDEPSLDRLRAHFGAKMNASLDASAFAVVTQNIDLQGVAFRDLAGKIASVDTLEAFMQDFRKRFDSARRMN
ncbi:MAG TPA: hypothetical protein VN154_00380, partial [Rhizomicrobium sp.]|nr:hypothetical protein [Rhizomicrobium sp.]